jgi:xanthine dehydrogenase accessory factor
MLLVVAESSGSSPGRKGYKMAIAEDGELFGSIGGGVMEVRLVEESRSLLSAPPTPAVGIREEVHRKDAKNASGMICSGKQTVIFRRLWHAEIGSVAAIIDALGEPTKATLQITETGLGLSYENKSPAPGEPEPSAAAGANETVDIPVNSAAADFSAPESDFVYTEQLGAKHDLYIIGGGHCALALSELMSKMDFRISIFDDRPELNTIKKNEYADEIKIVDSYDRIGDHIPSGVNAFVVVMTLGYKTDEIVVRGLINKEFKYFGVLGSKAKMSTMLRSLREEGISDNKLNSIHTPVGLPINSRTPEEIAVSIAAEIISVKNGNS